MSWSKKKPDEAQGAMQSPGFYAFLYGTIALLWAAVAFFGKT